MTSASRGRVVFSIDLELFSRAGSLVHERQLDELTRQILDLFEAHELPATLAVADPVHSAATELISSSRIRHELAVLGDASWIGRGAGRVRFARELDRRFHSAVAAGLPVSSLVLRNVELAENLDLLATHPITAVRFGDAARGWAQPSALRSGVWQMPVSVALPAARSWRWWPSTAATNSLKQAAQAANVAHISLDAGRLAESEHGDLRAFERALQRAAHLRAEGRLHVLTMADLARELSPADGAARQRSILQAA